jgi:signal transduction histidine kinase
MDSGVRLRAVARRAPTAAQAAPDCARVRATHTWCSAGAGLLLGAVAWGLGGSGFFTPLVAAVAGAAIGHAFSLRRALRELSRSTRQTEQRAAELAMELRSANELLAMARRQTRWLRRLDARTEREPDAIEHAVWSEQAQREAWVLALRKLAHDLRTPLTVFMSNVGVLREMTREDWCLEAQEALGDLELGVERMTRIVEDASRGAKKSAHEVEPVLVTLSSTELADRIAGRLGALFGKPPEDWQLRCAPDCPPTFVADELMLERALDVLFARIARDPVTACVAVELEARRTSLCITVALDAASSDFSDQVPELDQLLAGFAAKIALETDVQGRVTLRLELPREAGALEVARPLEAGGERT